MVSNLLLMLHGSLYTLWVSVLAVIFGLIIGTVLGVTRSRYFKGRLIASLGKTYVSVIRGTPIFIQILIIYFGLPSLINCDISPLIAGVIALGCNSAAYLAEILRGGINAVPKGQWEAARTLGYGKRQSFLYIILPQVFRNSLPSLTNEFVTLIKESSILMVVGVPELTKVSRDIVGREMKPMETYLLCALFYLVMTTLVSSVTHFFERKKARICG